MGYDDIPFARQLSVPLTTVRRPHYEMGTTAAEMLTTALTGRDAATRHVVFQPELVVRDSTAPLASRPLEEEQPMTQLLLGIDLGTGSSKGVLTTPDGEIVATAVRPRPHSMSMPPPGGPRWMPRACGGRTWSRSRASSCRRRAGRDRRACVSAASGRACVLTDDAGQPVRPAILYGIDSRATAEITELDERLGSAAVLRTLRHAPDHPGRRAQGAVGRTARARRLGARHPLVQLELLLVAFRLTGEYVLDHHTASQCVPLYDIEANTWYEPWYDEVMGELAASTAGLVERDRRDRSPRRRPSRPGCRRAPPSCAGTVDAWAEAFSGGVR